MEPFSHTQCWFGSYFLSTLFIISLVDFITFLHSEIISIDVHYELMINNYHMCQSYWLCNKVFLEQWSKNATGKTDCVYRLQYTPLSFLYCARTVYNRTSCSFTTRNWCVQCLSAIPILAHKYRLPI